MKTNKLFPCRIEELPVIGDFLLNSAKRDLSDFEGFSPMFTTGYLSEIDDKVAGCRTVVSTSVVSKELKATTDKLTKTYTGLRVPLNKLEGYLKLSANELDISVADFGLKKLRDTISKGNVEGIARNMQTFLTQVKRNQEALTAKGMTTALTEELESATQEIEGLNVKQNELISRRGRLSDENQNLFNELWSSLQTILKTGQALYKGSDSVKLKDYTMAQLLKRVNVEKSKNQNKQTQDE